MINEYIKELKKCLFIGIFVMLAFGAVGSYSGAMAEYTSTDYPVEKFSEEAIRGKDIPLFSETIVLAKSWNFFRNFRRAAKYIIIASVLYCVGIAIYMIIKRKVVIRS